MNLGGGKLISENYVRFSYSRFLDQEHFLNLKKKQLNWIKYLLNAYIDKRKKLKIQEQFLQIASFCLTLNL